MGDKKLRYRGRWKCPQNKSLPSECRFVGRCFPLTCRGPRQSVILKICSRHFEPGVHFLSDLDHIWWWLKIIRWNWAIPRGGLFLHGEHNGYIKWNTCLDHGTVMRQRGVDSLINLDFPIPWVLIREFVRQTLTCRVSMAGEVLSRVSENDFLPTIYVYFYAWVFICAGFFGEAR